MRRLLVLGFLILGLPNLFGFAIAACVRVALLCASPNTDGRLRAVIGGVVGGFATVVAAVIVAALFHVRLGQWLPVPAAIWFAIHFTLMKRAGDFVPASIGLLCGWLVYLIFLNGTAC